MNQIKVGKSTGIMKAYGEDGNIKAMAGTEKMLRDAGILLTSYVGNEERWVLMPMGMQPKPGEAPENCSLELAVYANREDAKAALKAYA